MNVPKFGLGDNVFRASYDKQEKYVQCPDCFGKRVLRVELGNGEVVAIDCTGCSSGYESPSGVIKQYDFTVNCDKFSITGISTSPERIEYDLNNYGGSYYTSNEGDLFLTKEEALANGELKKKAHEDEENRRFMAKTKDHRKWSWHVTHHRSGAKRAKEEMERHLAKLDIAKLKSKQPEEK